MKKLLYIILFLSFGVSAQIKVGVPFDKNSHADNSYTAKSENIKGGWHSVATIIQRDSLLSQFSTQLQDGMAVFVRADSTMFQRNQTAMRWDTIFTVAPNGRLIFNAVTILGLNGLDVTKSNPTSDAPIRGHQVGINDNVAIFIAQWDVSNIEGHKKTYFLEGSSLPFGTGDATTTIGWPGTGSSNDLATLPDITGGARSASFANLTLPGTTSQYVRGDGSLATLPSGGTTWGSITGTLSTQSDLNSILSGKQATLTFTGTGNTVNATSPTLVTPALGTPSSGVATNLTGTAGGLTAGTVTTNANLTGAVTSVGNATTINNINGITPSYYTFTSDGQLQINGKAAALKPVVAKTSNYTSIAGDFVPYNTTSGALVNVLPNAPIDGSVVYVKIITGTNIVTVRTSGSDVFNNSGGNTAYTVYFKDQGVGFQYSVLLGGWYILYQDMPKSAIVTKALPDTIAGRKTFVDTLYMKAVQSFVSAKAGQSDVFYGDSKTFGYQATIGQRYTDIVTSTLRHNELNYAISGSTMQHTGTGNSVTDQISGHGLTYSAAYYKYVFINSYTNDENGDTTLITYATYSASLRANIASLHTLSWPYSNIKVIAGYLLPNATTPQGTLYRHKRLLDSMKAICTSLSVQLIDANSTELAQYTATMGKTFADGIHENNDGHSVLAQYILQQLADSEIANSSDNASFNGYVDVRNLRTITNDTTTRTPTPLALSKQGSLITLPDYYFIRNNILSNTPHLGNINISDGIVGSTVQATGNNAFRNVNGITMYYFGGTGFIAAGNVTTNTFAPITFQTTALSTTGGLHAASTWVTSNTGLPGAGINSVYEYVFSGAGHIGYGDVGSGSVAGLLWVNGTLGIFTTPATNTETAPNVVIRNATSGQLEQRSLGSLLTLKINGTPTIAAGAGAGTSPTVSVTSNGVMLQVTVTTGTLPTGTNATIATVTLANALAYTPYPVFSGANASTSLLSAASMVYMTSTGTTNVTITSGTTALTAATTYIWNIAL